MRKTTKMVAVLAAMSVMILGAATMVSADEKNGWVKEGSDWYYYVKDEALTNGWALSGNNWYFLDEDGKMATEEFIDNDAYVVVENGEITDADNTEYYYVGADGAMVTGWANLEVRGESSPTVGSSKKWYYFSATGLMYAEEWVRSGSEWYWVALNGRMVANDLILDDGKEYYFNKDGAMITGWYKATDRDDDGQIAGLDENEWIYASADGELKENGWKKIGGTWYHFGTVSSASVISGAAVDGTSGDAFVMNAETFIADGSNLFYLKKSGAMATGLIKVDDEYYFAKASNGVLQSGIVEVSGKYYFFNESDFTRDDASDYMVETTVGSAKTYTVGTFANDAEARTAAAADNVAVYKLGTGTKFK